MLSALLQISSVFALELVSPKEGEEFCALKPEHLAFLELDAEGRRAKLKDWTWRERIQKKDIASTPLPLKLAWRGGNGPYEVKVTLDGKTVFATNLTATAVNVWNLEIAREYAWTVCAGGECARGHFRTRDMAPRLMYVPNVPNIRDLGGRIGFGGRRIRQGLAYRSAGLNGNASTSRDKPESEWRPGRNRMTPEGLHIANDILGWESDIDLRRDFECWGMTGSPAGAGVKWWHYPSKAYAAMATPEGREAFANVFKVFLDEKNYPVVFHCIGGADRTGAVAFILNALLGVCDDELDKDWEFTVFANKDKNFGHEKCFDKLRRMFDGYPGATTREKAEAYVKELGFTDADIARFRGIMLGK